MKKCNFAVIEMRFSKGAEGQMSGSTLHVQEISRTCCVDENEARSEIGNIEKTGGYWILINDPDETKLQVVVLDSNFPRLT